MSSIKVSQHPAVCHLVMPLSSSEHSTVGSTVCTLHRLGASTGKMIDFLSCSSIVVITASNFAAHILAMKSCCLRNTPERQRHSEGHHGSKEGAGNLIQTLKKSTGMKPKHGDYCLVHYEGFLEDGTRLDSSHALPLKFKVGAGQVMEGWEVAIEHLVEGQEVEVTIPHLYAYGEMGHPPTIPPRSTLIFRMKLLKITRA